MSIGFVGVGLMGGALARNLIRAGKDVLVFDLSEDATKRTLDAGSTGAAATSLDELGGCELVFTSLPMPGNVETVMLGPNGLYRRMTSGTVHVELSTIDPQTSLRLESAADQNGIGFLQCTLGKTPAHAERAEEPLFIGGKRTLFDELSDIWPIIGRPAHYMGGVDASCAVKLISNMVGMTNLAALAEGIRAGEKAGIDRNTLIELLQDTGARSFQMDVRGPRIAADDFENRFGLDLALKDVGLGCEMARAWGLNLKAIEASLQHYKKASTEGYGKEDCNAVFKVI